MVHSAVSDIEQTVPLTQRPAWSPPADGNSAVNNAASSTGHSTLAERAAQVKVLVVDDNHLNGELLSRHLISQGHVVVAVDSGARALALLQGQPFDVVLLDVKMPGLSGADVLREMKKSAVLCDIPVAMLGSSEDMDTIMACIDLGADDYLLKPIKTAALRTCVNASLEKKALRQSSAWSDNELLLLHRAARDVNGTLCSDRVATIMLERSLEHTAMPAGFIALLDVPRSTAGTATNVSIAAHIGYQHNTAPMLPRTTLAQLGLTALDLDQPRWVTARDREMEGQHGCLGLLDDACSWLIVPLRREQTTVAVMVLEDTQMRRRDMDIMVFLTRLAEHAASALRNAELYNALRHATQERQVSINRISLQMQLASSLLREHVSELPVSKQNLVIFDYIRSDAQILFSLAGLLTQQSDTDPLDRWRCDADMDTLTAVQGVF